MSAGRFMPIRQLARYSVRGRGEAVASGNIVSPYLRHGTEDLAIGDRLLVVQGTGLISKVAVGLIASPVSYPWQALETLVDQPAETLIHCLRTSY